MPFYYNVNTPQLVKYKKKSSQFGITISNYFQITVFNKSDDVDFMLCTMSTHNMGELISNNLITTSLLLENIPLVFLNGHIQNGKTN